VKPPAAGNSPTISGVSRESQFPLFPLGLVALPGEEVALHIFEERYRVMIEECISASREFGIVWLAEDELKPVGCTCAVDRVLERMGDGRFNVLVRGRRPFRLIEREDSLPYPAGTIEALEDEVELLDAKATEDAHAAYATLVEAAIDSQPEAAQLAGMNAYDMARTIEFGLDAKQELLELRSENARMRLLARMLRAALRQLELTDRAGERARSNGKVRFA
jgi:Lon protease-like protein